MDHDSPVVVERYMDSVVHENEKVYERSELRPQSFEDYPGQAMVIENLQIYVQAAKNRHDPLDHVLLHGPPGLGKTSLAAVLAKELEADFFTLSGPALDKPGDLAGILAGLTPGSVLFFDEIHRIPIQVEEMLYSAMEDFVIDLTVGQGATARAVRMPVSPFTLVGATTRLASLSKPFINRFGIQERLQYYNDADLARILSRSAHILGTQLSDAGALMLARCSRGTPRIANRLLRRARDFADVSHVPEINEKVVGDVLGRIEVDARGLDRIDRLVLQHIAERYQGGPVGIEALAVSVGEERATLEDVYEPWLVYTGLLARSSRGRLLTEAGWSFVRSYLKPREEGLVGGAQV
ncbi:MAG: Holliday junction branch migration DNA helicase RuvB [Oligoflexales bacterium]